VTLVSSLTRNSISIQITNIVTVKEQHLTRRYPPGPRRNIPLAGLLAYRKGPLPFFQNLAARYGDISYFRLGPQGAFFLNHPDYVRDVLVTNNQNFMKGLALQRAKRLLGEGLLTSEGEFHRRQKRLAQPAFHRARIASYAGAMTDYALQACAPWRDGDTVDMSEEMMRLTLAIVGRTLFDADVVSDAQEVGEAMTVVMDLFNTIAIPFFEVLQKFPLPQFRRFDKARAKLDAIIFRLIEERRRSGEDRGDLLSMLLLAQDTEGDGGAMTDAQLRDEVMTIFLAGHETTANALTWTWYLLSQNPEAEAKLHAELDRLLAGRLPNFEDVAQLKYTEMVLTESMRLFPPAWALGRIALDDFEIAGYVIPKKSIVLMSQFVMHHDPRYFADPMKFDPERWIPEAREARPQFSYFPFGGGPRRCIGEGFAWMEGILLLATIAQKWRMRLVPNHPVALKPVITLRPKHGMRMTVGKR
jgi:cytochrome P450